MVLRTARQAGMWQAGCLHVCVTPHAPVCVWCLLPVCLCVCVCLSAARAWLCTQVGAETFRLCRQLVDGVLLVDNAAISAAIKDVFNETRSILEPAGAVAVAGAKAWLKENGHKVCCVLGAACLAPAPALLTRAHSRGRLTVHVHQTSEGCLQLWGPLWQPPSPGGPAAPGQLLLCSHRPSLLCVPCDVIGTVPTGQDGRCRDERRQHQL